MSGKYPRINIIMMQEFSQYFDSKMDGIVWSLCLGNFKILYIKDSSWNQKLAYSNFLTVCYMTTKHPFGGIYNAVGEQARICNS